MSGQAERIRVLSEKLGGEGNVDLHYAPGMSDKDRPWQAVTTVKPRRHRDRRLWVWGRDPVDAMSRLLRAVEER